jgi:hypothetical protein
MLDLSDVVALVIQPEIVRRLLTPAIFLNNDHYCFVYGPGP